MCAVFFSSILDYFVVTNVFFYKFFFLFVFSVCLDDGSEHSALGYASGSAKGKLIHHVALGQFFEAKKLVLIQGTDFDCMPRDKLWRMGGSDVIMRQSAQW